VHLVDYTIEIYHDARSHERQKQSRMSEENYYLGQESHTYCSPTLERGRHVSLKGRNIFIILCFVTHQKTVLIRVTNYSHTGE